MLFAAFFVLARHQQQIAAFVLARLGGVKAALTSVTLNSGNGNVVVGGDITSETTALAPDTGAYRWTVNGSNYMAFNMPFDNGATLTDVSGNGNHGTPQGTLTFQSLGCKVGSCMVFDGSTGAVNTGSSSTTKLTGEMTISAWIRLNSVYNLIQVIASNNLSGGTGCSYQFEYGRTPNTLHFFNDCSTLGANSVGTISDNNWHHVLVTRAGSTGSWTIKFYIDGNLDSTQVISSNPGGSPGNMYVGKSGAWTGVFMGSTEHFNGTLDEVMLFPRVLSAAEVSQLYADGNAGIGGPTIIQSEETSAGQLWNLSVTPISSSGAVGSAIPSSNSVFIASGVSNITGSLNDPDEGSPIIATLSVPGGSAAAYRWVKNNANLMTFNIPFNSGGAHSDLSGNTNHGTPQNGAVFTTTGCKVGGCLSLDGVNDYVVITDHASLNLTGSQSVSAWVKPAGLGTQNVIYGRWGPTDHQTLLDVASSIPRWSVRTPAAASVTRASSVTMTTGTWYHVVGVYNSATLSLDIYVNGVLANGTLTGIVPASLRSPTVGVPSPRIGFKGDGTTEVFNGIIDEVQLYPFALSAAQIAQLYVDGSAGAGGPTRISSQEHALGDVWDLIAAEITSGGTVEPSAYIDSATIAAAVATTLGITDPSGVQAGNITVNYSCSNASSTLRDLLVEYSANGGSSFASATLVSASSGSVSGSVLSMVDCASGTSNNSFVWNSIADGVADISNAQIRITAQYTGGPSATTSNFNVDNPVNLCTAGGEASGGLTAAETSFDGTDVGVWDCTYTIDGPHTFSSLTVGNGSGSGDSILKHSATTTTTIFSLNITTTGNITINSDAIIDANGLGYLGANRGGNTGTATGRTTGNTTTGGSTNNVGGSHGGLGGRPANSVAVTYDSITDPSEPGGGGGSRDSANTGQTGGGVIRLTAGGDMFVGGTIRANGEQLTSVNAGGGAGGSIKLTAGGAFGGSGSITANGSNGVGVSGDSTGGGGGGRIAIFYETNTHTGTISAYGGLLANSGVNASAGTIYKKSEAQANGDLIVDNNNISAIISGTTLPSSPLVYDNMTVRNRGRAMITTLMADATPWQIGTLTVENNSDITSAETNLISVYKLNFSVTDLVIDATSTITTEGRGYYTAGPNKNTGLSTGKTSGNVNGSTAQNGGSHGGLGGVPSTGSAAATYDSITAPSDAGGGGGSRDSANNGRDGGGIIRIVATGTMTINGVLSADGELTGGSNGGGGAGGAIHINVGTLTGSGSIRANGSNGVGNNGDNTGGGGGGRVAIYYTTNSFAGTISAYGGLKANSGIDSNAGTVFMKSDVQTNGDLIIDNNNALGVISGTTLPNTPGVFDAVTIRNRGRARITQLQADTTAWDIGTLTLQTNSDLTSAESDLTNVYKLFLSVTNLNIDATSTITTDGRGYFGAGPGKTSSSSGRTVGNAVGSTVRVGGSHGGLGGQGSGTPAVTYDSITDPVEAGGGGGSRDSSNTGRDGGGIIKITASGTMTIDGAISSDGEQTGGSNGGGGAGGTVNITVGTLTGSGSIRANGSNGIGISGDNSGGGGGGRVAVYYTTNNFSGTIIAAGGLKANSGVDAGAGTVYLKHPSQTNGDLVVDNNSRAPVIGSTTMPTSPRVFDNTTIRNGSRLKLTALISDATPWSFGALSMQSSSDITSEETDLSNIYYMYVSASSATIDATSGFNVDGRGFLGANQVSASSNIGRTTGNTTVNGSTGGDGGGSGGSHGGRGASGPSAASGIAYDSLTAPVEPGAGGGARDAPNKGGDGGGIIRFNVDGSLTMNGTISAKGITPPSGVGGGGAGGSVYVTAGSLSGSGTFSVRGGDGYPGFGAGGGGGGRLAIYYGSSDFGGSYETRGGTSNSANHGASGTAFLKDNDESAGSLRLNNASIASNVFTPLFVVSQPTTYTFQDLYVTNAARLLIDTPCAGTPALTVNGVTDLSGSGTITNNQSGTCTLLQATISITTTTMPGGLVGDPYSEAIASVGGYGPHTFVLVSGSLPPGLSLGSNGVVSGTPTTTGTYVFDVSATEAAPGVGSDTETISLSVGNAPTAPTVLFAHNTDAQLGNTDPSGIDATPVFSAIFNDPDVAETALKYRVQVASDAGFTSLLWDSGASGTLLSAACAQGFRCANINYAGAALSLNASTYYWRIKFWDELNIEGAFSATAQFTTDQAPAAPTNLFSNDSTAQIGLTNPVGVVASHPVFSAVYNDPDIADVATQYRIQVDDNNDFSSVVWDSGAGGTNMASCNQGSRCDDITFGGTALTRDETTYYWRIKFWDQAGVEGAWSEDPLSTNTFTMGAGGTSTQRLQQIQQQDQQNQEPKPTAPAAPLAGSVEVLGENSVRYNWVDLSDNETGFRILSAQDQVIADVAAGVTQAVETNLPSNTVIEGRKVVAYNSVGQSAASEFSRVVTAAPVVRPVVQHRNGDSVTFTIEPVVTSFPGQTAVRYEVLVTDSSSVPGQETTVRTLTSEWIQSPEYEFIGIEPDDTVQVRVITRNQEGLQTEPTQYEDVAQLSRRFHVTIGVFEKGTNQLTRPIDPRKTLSVSMRVESIGTDPASSVILNLPLPRYIQYRPNTLSVDGRAKNDAADGDGAHANNNGVSASWARMNPGESHTVTFELVFDVPALDALRQTSSAPITDATRAQAIAAANPIISMQASVSFAESNAVYMSPVITLEPEVTLLETPVEEEVPVQLPTPEETQIIEQILQEEFGITPIPSNIQPSQPGEQPSAPAEPAPAPLQRGETNVSSDNGSFNVGVSNDQSSLGLSGSAEVSADVIRFTGTTTEPFTIVTLIFNDSITAIAVSDAEGNWQTFVDADRLGIAPGQDARVKIEAIAAKGELRSERVQVGDVVVSRGRSGDIDAEFDTTVSDSALLSVAEEIQHQVVKVIEKQEPVIQTTLSVAAPVVVVSSVPLWGYLPYVPTLLYHAITYLVGIAGRKKRMAAHFYGVVYDSITKQPLALAIIRIYKTEPVLTAAASVGAAAATNKKLVTTVVTDKLGRYDALLEPGTYQLEVAKPNYVFPSQIVSGQADGEYQNVYNMQAGIHIDGDKLVIPDVPLDPVNAQHQWQLATGFKKFRLAVQRVGNYLAAPILIAGSISSAAVVATIPDKPINWVIAAFYIILLALQLRLRDKVERAWGIVYDIATNAVLPLTTIQLIEPASSKVVTSRLSDYQGRFAFLPEPGTYVVKATKPGYQQVSEVVEAPQADRQPLRGAVRIDKPNQSIAGDIPMRQA